MADFTTLEGIMTMFSPSDMAGGQGVDLGGPLDKIGDATNPWKLLVGILENNGRGVLNIDAIEARLEEIKTKKEAGSVDFSKFLTMWTTKKFVDIGDTSAKHKQAPDKEGVLKPVTSLTEIIGAKFENSKKMHAAVFLSRSPFFNPANRNTRKSEIFMNGMPTIVMSQLVPYLQAEFQFQRSPSSQLQSAGLLKFLMGAADSSKDEFGAANTAMYNAATREGKDNGGNKTQQSYMGMEAFTSPQTLVNPTPNGGVGKADGRFTEVLDPFRPFASLEHVTVSVSPAGAGFFTYKKANMTIKLHDRSRLAEISDLLRPRVYTGVTIWMTYGWRAPTRGKSNPYFDYINNNMMMREAYHIVNSNFSFDNVGQVTINLELFTKGVVELRQMKITDNDEDAGLNHDRVKHLVEEVSRYRQALKLDPPESFNKEIRVYQILDAAETGNFPDLKASDAISKINSLYASLNKIEGIDHAALEGLKKALNDLYKPAQRDTSKYALKEEYETRVSSTIKKMFDEVRMGPDPFLPSEGKAGGADITKIIKNLNPPAATKSKTALNRAVSFGKLFSVFAMRGIMSLPDTVSELQVFFYGLNESCGPIRGHSIAEFPIDMNRFVDVFAELVKARKGEKITLEDFIATAINSEFLDHRAFGYGLNEFYQPYTKGKDAALKDSKDAQQQFENRLAAYSKEGGPFKMPTIEVHIECSHERVDKAGQSDILQAQAFAANKDIDYADSTGKAMKRIMRIHIYDKQTNAYKEAARLLKNPHQTAEDGFVSVDNDFIKEIQHTKNIDDVLKIYAKIATQTNGGKSVSSFTNGQQAKNLVSQLMPTIRFGANGTTITSANLSSKADPLLSSVQMMRTQNLKNTASPNGAGPSNIPLRVIPAQLTMTSLGNPLASAAQKYFIDFQTGTTLDNLYILTHYTHNFSPGKFETNWTFGFADGYGVFEGAPSITSLFGQLNTDIPKNPKK